MIKTTATITETVIVTVIVTVTDTVNIITVLKIFRC